MPDMWNDFSTHMKNFLPVNKICHKSGLPDIWSVYPTLMKINSSVKQVKSDDLFFQPWRKPFPWTFLHDVIEDWNKRCYTNSRSNQHNSFMSHNRRHRTWKWPVKVKDEFTRCRNFPLSTSRSSFQWLFCVFFDIVDFVVKFSGPIATTRNR